VTPVAPEVLTRYRAQGAEPVRADFAPPDGSPLVIPADVLDAGPVVRHAPDKLGSLLCELAAGHPRSEQDEG
jgi:hypothetical protein